MGDQGMFGLARYMKRQIEVEPRHEFKAPSQQVLESALAWLVAKGGTMKASRTAVAVALSEAARDDRNWRYTLQGYVNTGVRANREAWARFSGDWLGLWALLDAVEKLEELASEAHA